MSLAGEVFSHVQSDVTIWPKLVNFNSIPVYRRRCKQ